MVQNTILITLLLTAFNSLVLLAQDVLWEKSYGGKQADYLADAIPTADYGFILAGSSLSEKSGNKQENSYGGLDFWVWKMDETGSLDWQRNFGGSGEDYLQKVISTLDGGSLLAGYSNSMQSGTKKDDGFGMEDFWILKLNADGSEQWQKTIGGSGSELLVTAIQTADGGYLLGGSTTSHKSESKTADAYGNKDYWLIKLGQTGEIEWENSYGGNYVDEVTGICPLKDEGYIIIGYSTSGNNGNKTTENIGMGDYWIIRIDKFGNSIWQKSYGGKEDDRPFTSLSLRDGNLLIGGASRSTSGGNKFTSNKNGTDYWLIKLDEEGEIIWEKTYDIGEYDVLISLEQNKDGTILLGGYARSEKVGLDKKDSKGINDYVAIKIDSIGKERWRTEIGSNGNEVMRKLIATRDGGYLLTGTSDGEVSGERNSGHGRQDFWVVKLRDKEKDDDLIRKDLIEAIPNPTNGYTNVLVQFEFEKGDATVTDMSGKQLQNFEVTNRTIPVNLGNYPVGIYLVTVKTDEGTETVKIIKKD